MEDYICIQQDLGTGTCKQLGIQIDQTKAEKGRISSQRGGQHRNALCLPPLEYFTQDN